MAKHTLPTASEEAAERLRAFWITGTESWGRVDPGKKAIKKKKARTAGRSEDIDYTHGNKLDVLEIEAKEAGLNPDTMGKAWRVARQYTRAQIEELCELVVEHGAPFSATHLCKLLAVTQRARRDDLTRRAIRKRWSLRELERTLKGVKRTTRPQAGKKPVIPGSEFEFLTVLSGLCDKWLRWCTEAGSKMSDDLETAVKKATAAVETVKRQVEAKLTGGSKKAV